ncbi:MAG: ABC transporter substrate-binding protein [Marinilabiliaceae bacterium]
MSDEVAYRTIKDMRGVKVSIPDDPQRVVAISRSLIDTTMYILGVKDKIVGGSFYQVPIKQGQYVWKNKDYTVDTWIGKVINPRLSEVPNIGAFGSGPYGQISIEAVANCKPDLLILRDFGEAVEDTSKFISQVESLGIPVFVLKYPSCYASPNVNSIYQEIRLLGEIFKQKRRAGQIVATMQKAVKDVTLRIQNMPKTEQKSVLYFGAPDWAGDKGGVGVAFGTGTIEMALMEDMIKAKSVYRNFGTNLISAEHMLATDPDVIILCTYSGYHPPRKLYGKAYANIQEMRAIKRGRVYALPATPCKSERLELPISLMVAAKAVYPERFIDIDLKKWIHNYIAELYGADEKMVQRIMNCLMLEYLEIIS